MLAWDLGHPSFQPSESLRVLIYGRENSTYLKQPHTVLLRSKEMWMSLKSSEFPQICPLRLNWLGG